MNSTFFLGASLVCIIKSWRRLAKKKTFCNEKYVAAMWCKKKSEEKIVSCIIKFEEKHFFVHGQKGTEKEATCDSVEDEQAIWVWV